MCFIQADISRWAGPALQPVFILWQKAMALWEYPPHLFHPYQQPAAPSSLLASSRHAHLCAMPGRASCPASLHPPRPPPPVLLSSAKRPAPNASSAVFRLVFHVSNFFFLMFSSL